MMRSLSTIAFGQPSETRPTLGWDWVWRRAAVRTGRALRRAFGVVMAGMAPACSLRHRQRQILRPAALRPTAAANPAPLRAGQSRDRSLHWAANAHLKRHKPGDETDPTSCGPS